jgi:hypothetical protein
MIHQPMGGTRGQATDIDIQATEILKLRARMNEILARHTNKYVEQIASDTERDFYLSAEEAAAYGIVDNVVSERQGGLEAGDGDTPGPKASEKRSNGKSHGSGKDSRKAGKKGDDDN